MIEKNCIHLGNNLDTLRLIPDNTLDSCVTDPPYGINFMNKKWDYDVPSVELWKEVYRVLKPGAHILVACGTRTQHRMAVNIEDAGFEIRDLVAWIYGQGFPKSMDVGKQIEMEMSKNENRNDKRTSGQQKAKYDMRSMRETNISAPVNDEKKQREVLFEGMQKQSICVPDSSPKPCERKPDGEKPSMEGRNHIQEKQRELYRPEICSLSERHDNNGTEGRLCDGTPPCDGKNDGKTIDENGSCPSYRPQPKEQQPREFDVFPQQPSTQSGGKESNEWQGWGTALKPAMELWTLARKPIKGTVAENVLKYGTGGINIDATRVFSADSNNTNGDNTAYIIPLPELLLLRRMIYTHKPFSECETFANLHDANVQWYVENWKKQKDCLGNYSIYLRLYDELSPLFQADGQVSFQQLRDVLGGISRLRIEPNDNQMNQDNDRLSNLDDLHQTLALYHQSLHNYYTTQMLKKQVSIGRFPANVIHDGSDEVVAMFPKTTSGFMSSANNRNTDGSPNGIYGKFDKDFPLSETYGDSGSAARFFYTAKASQTERNDGLWGFEEETDNSKGNGLDRVCEFCGTPQLTPEKCRCNKKSWVLKPKKNFHPTVKPLDLMRYLVRMITPKGGCVLEPFAGSGTTCIAAKQEKMDYIGMEIEEDYVKIAEARIKNAVVEYDIFDFMEETE